MECPDYKLSRRAMLGAASATFMGFSVRQLLALEGTSHAPKAEHVILFWNGGGMSHIDTWDPKPGRPTQGEFQASNTSVPDLQIAEIFPELAKQMHHCSLIRSIAGTNGDHGRAQKDDRDQRVAERVCGGHAPEPSALLEPRQEASCLRHLGIEVDDALEMAERTEC